MTSDYDLLEFEEIVDILNNIPKKQVKPKTKSILFEWIQSNEWQQVIYKIQSGFLKLKTRQKSIFIRFFDAIKNNHFGETEQTIWMSYVQIQNYATDNVERKYITYIRNMIRSFYIFYIGTNCTLKDEEQLKSIMLNNEPHRMQRKIDPENILGTNFPLHSKYFQVISIECHAGDKAGNSYYYDRNFYIDSNNTFIINIMKDYLIDLKKTSKHTSFNSDYFRYFLYHFEKSLNKNVTSLKHFSKVTFFNQVEYYKSLVENELMPSMRRKSVIADLARFYRYIDNIVLKLDGDYLFKNHSFNSSLLRSKLLKSSIEEGFEFVLISKFDSIPKSNKWTVIPDNTTLGTTRHIYRKIDFTLIENEELRWDLKRFIWHANSLDHIHRFTHLVEFLNRMHKYTGKHDFNLNESLMSEFITFYYVDICDKNDITNSMKNSIIFSIRTLLRSIQLKYNISENQLLLFRELPREAFYSGNPITVDDFNVINRHFYNMTRGKREELYILFKLSILTKLRPGELINLERNCIVSKNEQYGTIAYYSKMSSKEKNFATFPIDIIREIEHALDLTYPSFKIARPEDRKYIFIGPRYEKAVGASEYKVMHLNYPYRTLFNSIISELYENNQISRWYTTYSCRDTHINNAFELLEDGKINSFELTTITGNSAKIARKHYLSKDRRTRHYLENLYEVSLLDVDIEGNVEVNKSENALQHIVQDDAGSCSSSKCIKETSFEDSSYKCLTCKYFMTTLEKIPVFEDRVNTLRDKVNRSSNKQEKEFYTHSLKLNLAYLEEMYSIRGEL
ncbi:hypothetical protein [Jeotgalicoccus psychrophilus]|uniref:hypothetical protein n=1 Tax=Jeotgalicoccus psychrophilus TaxID=157228 RepID=UPI0004111CCA|nr:hypothetical protein [Jeotgalicoccus psychrophilus]